MRLIDADALLLELNNPKGLILLDGRAALVSNEWGCLMRYGDVVAAVESALTIDAEPVVRCKECKYARAYDKRYVTCLCHPTFIHYSPVDGYCYLGKKMDGGLPQNVGYTIGGAEKC